MELKSLQNEMRRLSEIIDSWNSTNDIPQIERDLVLSKLRYLYDMVRFCEPAIDHASNDQQDNEQELSVELDLGDVLSFGFIPELDVNQSRATVDLIVESGDVADNLELVAEPEHKPVVEPNKERMPFVEVVEAAIEPEPDLHIEIVENNSEPVQEPTPRPQPMLATLFGGEEPISTSHRQRQRVIMSLYDDDQPMDSASTRGSKSDINTDLDDDENVFEELSLDTIVTSSSYAAMPCDAAQGASKCDAAPADESFGGDESLLEPTPAPSAEIDDPSPEASIEPARTNTIDSSSVNHILGDVIKPRVQILADSFASQSERITDAAHRASVGPLRSILGLNDRYLLMHDLFNNDAAACDAALAQFDQFDNLDDCVIYIAENFSWNPDCAGAKFLMEMLERKFI